MTTVTVIPVADADLPPRPDPAKVKAYFDRGPVAGNTAPADTHAGHYQQIVLDTVTGALYFHGQDWRTEQRSAPKHGGTHWGDFYALVAPVPRVLYWMIDSGIPVKELPYLDARAGNALAERIRPLAQQLVDHLVPVPGTETRDWTAEAVAAGRDIARACTRYQHPPLGRAGYHLVQAADVAAALPQVVDPAWAEMGDAALDRAAEILFRLAFQRHPQLYGLLGFDEADRPEIVGARAFAYAYRAEQHATRQPLDAAAWFSRPERSLQERVTADTTDAQLEQLAEREQDAATAEGVTLLGTRAATAAHRDAERARLLEQLPNLGAARDRTRMAAAAAHAEVLARIAKIASWGDPALGVDVRALAESAALDPAEVEAFLAACVDRAR